MNEASRTKMVIYKPAILSRSVIAKCKQWRNNFWGRYFEHFKFEWLGVHIDDMLWPTDVFKLFSNQLSRLDGWVTAAIHPHHLTGFHLGHLWRSLQLYDCLYGVFNWLIRLIEWDNGAFEWAQMCVINPSKEYWQQKLFYDWISFWKKTFVISVFGL